MKNDFPQWVLEHKRVGTEIRRIKGRFYLYEVTSKWDAKLKRPKKVTVGYLGSITREGFKPKKQVIASANLQNITVLNYGAIAYLHDRNKDIIEALKEFFPDHWSTLFLCGVYRLLYRSPLKKMQFYYQNSYANQIWTEAHMNDTTISKYLFLIGQRRGSIIQFFKRFQKGSQFVLIDGTDLPTATKSNDLATLGYNNSSNYKPQINALFIFAQDEKVPIYYRLTGGDIREITSMKLAVSECGLKDAVIIGDKGFYSKQNIKSLLDEQLHFAIPLKRNNALIDYRIIKRGDKTRFDGYFLYQKRPIWYTSKRVKIDKRYCYIYLYLDEQLYQKEQQDYLLRMENARQGYTEEHFHGKQHRFGTLALIVKLPGKTNAQQAYEFFKTRNEVEQMIDVFKNIIDADRSYMRDEHRQEGWMFINHLALMMYYRIYKELKELKLLKKYAPIELLEYFNRIHKVSIDDQWRTAEIPKVTRRLMQKVNLPIT